MFTTISAIVLAIEKLVPFLTKLIDLALAAREEAKRAAEAKALAAAQAAKDARNAAAIADAQK